MSSSEVMKVRLTAEGIQEVVASLKKVRGGVEETAKAGKAATDALGSLGTIFAARQLATFVAGAIDAADGLSDLSQKTGVAVEQLSVFIYLAHQADVGNEDLAKGFSKLAKSMDALASGDSATVEAFKRIGLSVEELKGLSLDQVMVKIANAQAGFADGAGKAAVMMQIFGKSGSNLIPLMNDLANGGFENAKAKLQELGLVISKDMAQASEEFNKSMNRLKMASEGAAVQVSQGLLPGMTKGINGLTEALAKMPIAAKAFASSFLVIGTAATAASVAVKMLYTAIAGLGPIGLAVVAISAMTAGLIALNAAEEAAQAETIKNNQEQYNRVQQGQKLVEQYQKEASALNKGGLSAKARKEHEARLKTLEEEIVKLGPAYKDAIDKGTGSLQERVKALKEVNKQQAADLENQRKALEAQLAAEEKAFRFSEANRSNELRIGRKQQEQLSGEVAPPEIEQEIARRESKALEAGLAKIRAKYKPQIDALAGVTPAAPEEDKPTIPDVTDPSAKLRAQVAALAAAAKRELDDHKQFQKQWETETENAYKDGEISLEDYLATRKAILQEENNSELEAIKQQISAEEKARDSAKKPEERIASQTKIDDLNAQFTQKWNDGETKLQALEREGRDKRLAAAEEALKLEAELDEAKGQTGEKALEVIQAEYDARIKAAESDPEKAKSLGELQRLALLRKRSEIADQTGSNATATMQNGIAALDQDQSAGKIGSLAADQQRVMIYQQWLAIMDGVYAKQKAIADESGNPVLLANAETLRISIEGCKNSVAQLSNEWADVQEAGANALASGLVDTLSQVGNGAGAVADAFRSMATSIVQSIQQAIVKMMLMKAVQGMLGPSAAAGNTWSQALVMAFGGSFASGGVVQGPGTGTSDAILARLSNGEFVHRAAAVDYYGADFMRALNGLQIPKGSFPRYATGGLVASVPQQGIKGDFTHQIGLTLDRGIIAEFLKSPEGTRVIAQQVAANPKRFNAALGNR